MSCWSILKPGSLLLSFHLQCHPASLSKLFHYPCSAICLMFTLPNSMIYLSNYPTQPFKSLHSRPILKPLLNIAPLTPPWFDLEPDPLITVLLPVACESVIELVQLFLPTSVLLESELKPRTLLTILESVPLLTELKPRYLFNCLHLCFFGLTLNQGLC